MATGTATEQLDRIDNTLAAMRNEQADFYAATSTALDNQQTTLNQIRDALSYEENSIAMLAFASLAELGTIRTVLVQSHQLLGAIRDNTLGIEQVNSWLDLIDSKLSGIGDNTANTFDRLGGTNSLLDFIRSTLGAGDGPPNDIIGYLRELAEKSREPGCPCTGINQTVEGCENQYTSFTMELIPFFLVDAPDVVVARFPDPPPEGVEFGNFFNLQTLDSELYNAEGWEGWQMFVASRAEQFSVNPASLERKPTNVWLPMDDLNTSVSFAVDSTYGLVVHLCPAPVVGPPDGASGAWGWGNVIPRDPGNVTYVASTFMTDIDTGLMTPNPLGEAGRVLYFSWCQNQTSDSDKTLWIGSSDDPESIFLTIPEGETVAWTIESEANELALFAKGDESFSSIEYAGVWIAWTEAEAIAACS